MASIPYTFAVTAPGTATITAPAGHPWGPLVDALAREYAANGTTSGTITVTAA